MRTSICSNWTQPQTLNLTLTTTRGREKMFGGRIPSTGFSAYGIVRSHGATQRIPYCGKRQQAQTSILTAKSPLKKNPKKDAIADRAMLRSCDLRRLSCFAGIETIQLLCLEEAWVAGWLPAWLPAALQRVRVKPMLRELPVGNWRARY